jgi:multiple sugar transport system substrate-binding protein
VPVTSKAQESPEYQDYLSRCGEDNDLYYDVKIKAAKLLLNNTQNSFITPVFNGSASLRDAAGQLIESTTKSVLRKDTIDEAYMEKLFPTISSLYRLDQIQTSSSYRAEFEALPTGSVILLSTLAGVWIIMGIFIICTKIKGKKAKN